MLKKLLVASTVCLIAASQSSAALIISQYYEGASTNKWIELFNSGPGAFDLSTVQIGLWTNANAEGYKSNTAPSQSLVLSGSLASGSTFLLGNTGNTANLGVFTNPPTFNLNSNSVINFNGNDSVAIYNAGAFSTASLIDAVGFTNAGNQGQDRSFVRSSFSPGFNTTAGSNITDFPSVWSLVSLATANGAAVGTDNFLGFAAIPEPTSLALGLMGGCTVLLAASRRRKAKS